jgi:hypothetical protein
MVNESEPSLSTPRLVAVVGRADSVIAILGTHDRHRSGRRHGKVKQSVGRSTRGGRTELVEPVEQVNDSVTAWNPGRTRGVCKIWVQTWDVPSCPDDPSVPMPW